jgi:hypothetical protein
VLSNGDLQRAVDWLIKEDNRDAHTSQSGFQQVARQERNRHPTVSVVPLLIFTCTYTLGRHLPTADRMRGFTSSLRTFHVRALAKVKKEMLLGAEKDTSGKSESTTMQPSHYSCDSTICGGFWTAACLRMPALNTPPSSRNRDEFFSTLSCSAHTTIRQKAVLPCQDVLYVGILPYGRTWWCCCVSFRDVLTMTRTHANELLLAL